MCAADTLNFNLIHTATLCDVAFTRPQCDSLSLHEAIPGHHTQAAVSSETPGLEDFRKYAEDRRYFEAPCRFPFYTGYIEVRTTS